MSRAGSAVVLCALLVIVLAVSDASALITASQGDDPQCGIACGNDNDCLPSQECSYCYHGTCTKGLTCGASCWNTADCDQRSNCSLCSNSVCSPGCAQPCNTSSECISYGCGACVNSVCILLKCNAPCTSDANCEGYGEYCSQCDQPSHGAPGVCKSGCGKICAADQDCPVRCPFCSAGVCGVAPEEIVASP